MLAFHVKNCVISLLLLKVYVLESRPTPFLGPLLSGLFGIPMSPPPMYGAPPPSIYGTPMYVAPPPQTYGQQYPPMLNLQSPVPLYQNQPMPALYPQTQLNQQPMQNEQPMQNIQPNMWSTTRIPGAAQNLVSGLATVVNGVFAAVSGIFNAAFGTTAFYPSPWVAM